MHTHAPGCELEQLSSLRPHPWELLLSSRARMSTQGPPAADAPLLLLFRSRPRPRRRARLLQSRREGRSPLRPLRRPDRARQQAWRLESLAARPGRERGAHQAPRGAARRRRRAGLLAAEPLPERARALSAASRAVPRLEAAVEHCVRAVRGGWKGVACAAEGVGGRVIASAHAALPSRLAGSGGAAIGLLAQASRSPRCCAAASVQMSAAAAEGATA